MFLGQSGTFQIVLNWKRICGFLTQLFPIAIANRISNLCNHHQLGNLKKQPDSKTGRTRSRNAPKCGISVMRSLQCWSDFDWQHASSTLETSWRLFPVVPFVRKGLITLKLGSLMDMDGCRKCKRNKTPWKLYDEMFIRSSPALGRSPLEEDPQEPMNVASK